MMDLDARIYVAGHQGLVGLALVRALRRAGYSNLALRTHAELDLTNQAEVERFFTQDRPAYVFLAAAKVGGILANNTYPADFISQNLLIQANVIECARKFRASRLLFLGSSCIYPKFAPQPISESSLLSGTLEPTNRPYAVAKIAGIEMCWAYNRQYGTRYLAAMPTNLYGPGDNYDLETSHVIPALLRKMHEAKANGRKEIVLWGTGTARREFLYSDDLAEACLFFMNLDDQKFNSLVGSEVHPPLINVGSGMDQSIRELAQLVADVIGYDGEILFDPTKPDGTPRKLLDTSRLRSLGWRPAVSLREGLEVTSREFLESFRESAGESMAKTSRLTSASKSQETASAATIHAGLHAAPRQTNPGRENQIGNVFDTPQISASPHRR
jgi:GDP-L-fucose synthase